MEGQARQLPRYTVCLKLLFLWQKHKFIEISKELELFIHEIDQIGCSVIGTDRLVFYFAELMRVYFPYYQDFGYMKLKYNQSYEETKMAINSVGCQIDNIWTW